MLLSFLSFHNLLEMMLCYRRFNSENIRSKWPSISGWTNTQTFLSHSYHPHPQSKAPWSSSWMNGPNSRWLLFLWVFVRNYTYKNVYHWTFILMKFKSFSCETYCTSTRSEKETNDNSEVELNSAYKPSAPSWPGNYPSFYNIKRLGAFLLPPPPTFNSPVPIYTTMWKEALWELSVLPKYTVQWYQPER